MANETTFKVKASADGNNYTIEIVEEEAKTGDRIDQRVARAILDMDEKMRNPQFMQAMQSMQQQQGQNMRWSNNPNQRQMPPFGGMSSNNPGFFGGGPGMNFGQNNGF